jgi:hypothetical protein
MLETLRSDFHRIPELLVLGPPEQPQPLESLPELEEEEPEFPPPASTGELVVQGAGAEPATQLGLF